jgi:TolB-like protein/tetratricopeptide (TPR) repeat protein
MRNFLAELRRRKVLRVAGLYVVAAWVVIQAAGEVFAAWQVPEETLRLVWIGALVGFPLVLVFSWYYDITSEGIVHTAPRTPDHDVDVSLHKIDYVILGALLFVFAFTTYGLFIKVADVPMQRKASSSVLDAPENSIAVLPFVNMSADPDNDYFSDGISEELLNGLAQLADLHVAARTSAFYFKGRNEDISHIASQLGVRNILEGSVRKAGNTLRITAQLIDASNGYHLWSATYDRELGDVFAIQDDISASVIDALRVELLGDGADRMPRQPTENMEAYDAYLVGLQLLAQGTSAATQGAIESFERAVELDPEYALAYVGIADAYLQLSTYGSLGYEEIFANAEPAVSKALELNSKLGEAYAALGVIETWRGDAEAAETAFRTALKLNPGYSRTYLNYGIVLKWNFGKVEEALEMHQTALGLDPLSIPINMAVADDYQMLGRHDEALARSKRVIEIDPDFPRAYVLVADMYWEVFGELDQAVTWLNQAVEMDPGNPDHARWLGMIYIDLGDFDAGAYWIRKTAELAPDRLNSKWGEVYLQQNSGTRADVLRVVNELLQMSPTNEWARMMLAADDVRAGRLDAALERSQEALPNMMHDDNPIVDKTNFGMAINLASVLIELGRREHAEVLLNRSLKVMRSKPRLGYHGYKISDVEAYALLGDEEQALSLLRSAVDDGWRYSWRFALKHEASLDSLRDMPRFQAIIDELENEMAAQLSRIQALKANGELPAPERL